VLRLTLLTKASPGAFNPVFQNYYATRGEKATIKTKIELVKI
jgi:hypothetical protein